MKFGVLDSVRALSLETMHYVFKPFSPSVANVSVLATQLEIFTGDTMDLHILYCIYSQDKVLYFCITVLLV